MNLLSMNLRGVRDDRKTSWVRGLKTSYGIHFLGIQESKLRSEASFILAAFWGRTRFCTDAVAAEGRSGGILSIWDPSVFQANNVVKDRYFFMREWLY